MSMERSAHPQEARTLAPRCLVVDDDDTLRRSIGRVTEALGLEPLLAASGAKH